MLHVNLEIDVSFFFMSDIFFLGVLLLIAYREDSIGLFEYYSKRLRR